MASLASCVRPSSSSDDVALSVELSVPLSAAEVLSVEAVSAVPDSDDEEDEDELESEDPHAESAAAPIVPARRQANSFFFICSSFFLCMCIVNVDAHYLLLWANYSAL